MNTTIRTVTTLAFLLAAGFATAQQSTDAATAQTGAETGVEAQTPGDLALGEEVAQASAPKQPYVREEVGDWALRCIPVDSGEEPCQLYQLLFDQSGNSVAEISMFRLGGGGKAEAGATIVVPLETLLTAPVVLAVDGGKAKRYPYSFCSTVGCYSRIGLTAEDIASFKRGAKATMTIVPFAAPDQQVSLDISLSGFTAGYEKVTVASPN